MYSPRKIAQIAAYFAQRQGGIINVLKLTKLLYLADRESLRQFGRPITYDLPVSMPHGPVLSRSKDLMDGFVGGAAGAQWDEWMNARANHDISVKRQFDRNDLKELSDADMDVLASVWQKFGAMDQWTLRDWTHENCSEWKDPEGSSVPIDDVSRLRGVGYSPDQARQLAAEIRHERELDALFAQA